MNKLINSSYLSFLQESEKLINKDNSNKESGKPKIVVFGLMNAGKSYLLNMLTSHIKDEYFKTNDFRETTENKFFESNEFIYIDTPGLDANEDDDSEAFLGVENADIVLFVHQPQGELEAKEIDFLTNLKTSFGKYADTNIILVISKVDKESSDKINLIENRVLEQCNNNIGFNPKCFQISGTRFYKGVNEHKASLTKLSHIQELAEHINTVAKNSSDVKKERTLQEIESLLERLSILQNKLSQERLDKKEALISEFHSFSEITKNFKEYVQRTKNRLNDI